MGIDRKIGIKKVPPSNQKVWTALLLLPGTSGGGND